MKLKTLTDESEAIQHVALGPDPNTAAIIRQGEASKLVGQTYPRQKSHDTKHLRVADDTLKYGVNFAFRQPQEIMINM